MEADRSAADSATPAAAPRRPSRSGAPSPDGSGWPWRASPSVYLVVVVLAVRRGPPLGWDESVYSLRARDFADGAAPRQLLGRLPRPRPSLAAAPVLGAGRPPDGVPAGCGRLRPGWSRSPGCWPATSSGPGPGLIAAAGVALAPPLVLAATQVWPDVPGAAWASLAVALFVFATGGERPSWWMLALVPAVAAATFLRFGAPLPMAIGLLGVAVWRRRVLLRHPAPAMVAALAATAAVVRCSYAARPHRGRASPLAAIAGFEGSWLAPGSPTTPAWPTGGGPGGGGPGSGRGGGRRSAGRAGGRSTAARCRRQSVAGLATAAALALVLHGEVRYLAPAYPWLWVAGAPGLAAARRGAPRPGALRHRRRARRGPGGGRGRAGPGAQPGRRPRVRFDAGGGLGDRRRGGGTEPCLVVTAGCPR